MDQGGQVWLTEGQRLLKEVRPALAEGFEVDANEDWWHE
jgi:hypothetical protein